MVYRTLGTSWSVYLTPAGTTLRPLEVKAQCQWTVTCTIYLGLPLQHCVMHICEVNVSRNHLAAASSNVLHADADADADADAGKPLYYFHNGLSISRIPLNYGKHQDSRTAMVYRTLGALWLVYLTSAVTTLRPLEVKAQCQWTVTCTIYLGLPHNTVRCTSRRST